MTRPKLPPDRLPKGTRLHLAVLLRRCEQLSAVNVPMPRQSLQALERTVAYLAANPVEGGRS